MIGKDYKWYVVYTRSQHEKRLNEAVSKLNIETYLPITKTLRIWSDRKKVIEMPLFPNYLFVRASCKEYVKIIEHHSVIGFVKNSGELSVVPENVLFMIKKMIEGQLEYQLTTLNPSKGTFVNVISGPLVGFSGKVIQSSGGPYLTIEILQINRSFLVKIDRNSITDRRIN